MPTGSNQAQGQPGLINEGYSFNVNFIDTYAGQSMHEVTAQRSGQTTGDTHNFFPTQFTHGKNGGLAGSQGHIDSVFDQYLTDWAWLETYPKQISDTTDHVGRHINHR